MANSSNNVNLIGRLTKDPELKMTSGGQPMVRFTIAVNREFKNKEGVREADFINCIAWRGQAESIAKYVGKGSLVGVNGRLQTSRFTREDGTSVYSVDVAAESVQFLESRRPGESNQGASAPAQQNKGAQPNVPQGGQMMPGQPQAFPQQQVFPNQAFPQQAPQQGYFPPQQQNPSDLPF